MSETTLTGLDKITSRILDDARAEADAVLQKARAEADGILADAKLKAAERRETVLARAKEQAKTIAESTASSAENRAKNALLFLKNDYADKAFASAKERFIASDDGVKTKVYASLLADAALSALHDGAKALLLMGRSETVSAQAVITEAKERVAGRVEIEPCRDTAPFDYGFLVKCGDVEINGELDKVFAQLKTTLAGPVLSVLFGK